MKTEQETRAAEYFNVHQASGSLWEKDLRFGQWWASTKTTTERNPWYLHSDGEHRETIIGPHGETGWFATIEDVEAAYDKWLAKQPRSIGTSDFQKRVDQFMRDANQTVRDKPAEPTPEERVLRAKLTMEEAFEKCEGLGVEIHVPTNEAETDCVYIRKNSFRFEPSLPFNMVEAVDGCCDSIVINLGTLSCLGVNDIKYLGPPEVTNDCGAVCCAVGMGPAAGIPPLEGENDWEMYSDRVFGLGHDDGDEDAEWQWCFSCGWRHTDNTPQGAAARIRWMLKEGVPDDWDDQMEGYADLCYSEPTQ